MLDQPRFDVGGRDPETAHLEHVVCASLAPVATFLVSPVPVAGVEPAVADAVRRLLGLVPVLAEHAVSPDVEIAGSRCRRRPRRRRRRASRRSRAPAGRSSRARRPRRCSSSRCGASRSSRCRRGSRGRASRATGARHRREAARRRRRTAAPTRSRRRSRPRASRCRASAPRRTAWGGTARPPRRSRPASADRQQDRRRTRPVRKGEVVPEAVRMEELRRRERDVHARRSRGRADRRSRP